MDNHKVIGVAITGQDSMEVVERVQQAEQMGVSAAWLTTGGAGRDALTLFAAVAVHTKKILLGTSITPTWPRHPVAMAQQVRVLAELAQGRFRLGVGPSHKAGMEHTYGVEFHKPLSHLREYLYILKALIQQGEVNFDGTYYHAHARTGIPLEVPVMASALRRGSFELCGAEADGAITWVCAGAYLRDVAVPAMQAGARLSGRDVPPLIAHAPMCVNDDMEEVRSATREQMGGYPSNPFYTRMFVDSGFPEVAKTQAWSDRMIDAVILGGNESRVSERIQEMFSFGASEILVTPILAGKNKAASMERTLSLIASVDASGHG